MKKHILGLGVILFSGLSAVETTSITDGISEYLEYTLRAANGDAFADFRRSPIMQEIMEINDPRIGDALAEHFLVHYGEFLPYVEAFRKNDAVGNPIVYQYGELGEFAPCTLRYMNIGAEIASLFALPKEPKIIELGSAYGGQCRVLSLLTSPKEYSLVDLIEVLPLAKRYLRELGVPNVKFYTPHVTFTNNVKFDLFVSNYAFSECTRDIQLMYFEKVLKRCDRGYIIYNRCSSLFGIDSMTAEELFFKLVMSGMNPTLREEFVNSANTEVNEEKNILITWDRTAKPND